MTPEYGWLIEHNVYVTGHKWLRVIVDMQGSRNPTAEIDFTPHAEVALRFARKEDAEAFIYLHPGHTLNCRATNHQFGV